MTPSEPGGVHPRRSSNRGAGEPRRRQASAPHSSSGTQTGTTTGSGGVTVNLTYQVSPQTSVTHQAWNPPQASSICIVTRPRHTERAELLEELSFSRSWNHNQGPIGTGRCPGQCAGRCPSSRRVVNGDFLHKAMTWQTMKCAISERSPLEKTMLLFEFHASAILPCVVHSSSNILRGH